MNQPLSVPAPGGLAPFAPNEVTSLKEVWIQVFTTVDPETLLAGSLAGIGPIKDFEREALTRTGGRFALAVANATLGLYALLLALEIGSGDEVIVPAYGWGGTVTGVLRRGATPIFADVDRLNGAIDLESVARLTTSRTRAVIAVHLFGCPVPNLPRLQDLCRKSGLALIEDCAQAWSAAYDGIPVGRWGRAGVYSFSCGKPLSAGEGGLILTDDEDLYDRLLWHTQHPLRQKRDGSGWIQSNEFALNCRAHPLSCLFALTLLRSSPLCRRLAGRRFFCEALYRKIAGCGMEVIGLPVVAPTTQSAWTRFTLLHLATSRCRYGWPNRARRFGLTLRQGPYSGPLYGHTALRSYHLPQRCYRRRPGAEWQAERRFELVLPQLNDLRNAEALETLAEEWARGLVASAA